ncbi:uncharacterized protein BX663DRAFT_562014 [Cokeromyces recurvatus]|uniref:uncharacterized protein n=1 Tax=Cokeromyces recurvatus TaxID=90255 RepID=UPI0022203E03|nr:uncharacterized protein BX663DRAFT_562014 [Cokeromyces recurvatus]KAI7901981.1 hypothetical protein BX663DRAFT_562014 [Cokeromyces recurvatus]
MSNKRNRSSSIDREQDRTSDESLVKRNRIDNTKDDLLSELSQVLNTIKSTPSSGEISAEVMETFKILMLEIDQLSADESNLEAKRMKQESELCLESWFDDLLARCEADGELNLEDLENLCASDEEEDAIAFAISQEDDEDDEDELIIVDDEGSEVGGTSQPLIVS